MQTPNPSREPIVATQIETNGTCLTLINVFSVTPERQQELVDLLVDATEHTMKHLPGFISANSHRSHDGGRVVNYAQWRTREDFEAMLSNPAAQPHMAQAAELADFDPILCEVLQVHHA